ncbi:hypothetical protein V2J09_009993 [Rumex salicifolius]
MQLYNGRGFALSQTEHISSSSSGRYTVAAMELQPEWPSNKVRETYIKFFQEKDHTFWKSSPVVPVNDPSLFFANAGMNQFKPIFLGTVDPNSPLAGLKRACNMQKCIRAGGKHNDLDDVYKLPTDRFYATYFGGDETLNLGADTEARDIWLKFLPAARVLPFGCKDNFWEMGDTGPCGPCTEIHFDRIGGRDAASLVNNDDPTCIEIWNLVFIQFNREPAIDKLNTLPAKHVDTGMGFERLTSILQNKLSNYDTDVFIPIFDAIQLATGAHPYSGKVGANDVDKVDMAYRVVADHIRTLCFAIADGSCPDAIWQLMRFSFSGNEGREYVLRRILRRAVRYGREFLQAQEGFFHGYKIVHFLMLFFLEMIFLVYCMLSTLMCTIDVTIFTCLCSVGYRLVHTVVEVAGNVFPELKQHEEHIKTIIADEEASFGTTLLRGISQFNRVAQGKTLSGKLMAEERGLTVDMDGFNAEMDAARERSRNVQSKQASFMDANATATLHSKGVPTTDDSSKFIWFQDHESTVGAIYTGTEFLESATAGNNIGLILESTSFYAEQGGQTYDDGSIECHSGTFKVCNVKFFGGFVLHIGSFIGQMGSLSVGDKVVCKVNYVRRQEIAPNHTCTHILNFALKKVLGDHVDQRGSNVYQEKLTFDFSHGKPVESEDLREIEEIVNKQIKAELDVYSKEATLADAKSIKGLRAVFGEIYPDPVRVVSIGKSVEEMLANPDNKEWLEYSTELCGGTHISNTREAKAFALISENGTGKGVRRVTAVTTTYAIKAIDLARSLEQKVLEAGKLDEKLLEKKVADLKSSFGSATIPLAMKNDIHRDIQALQKKVEEYKDKIKKENSEKVMKAVQKEAEAAISNGKAFCVSIVDVGMETEIVKKAVLKVVQEQEIPAMVFSKDESSKKVLVYAGVPGKGNTWKGLNVLDWLAIVKEPLKGYSGNTVKNGGVHLQVCILSVPSFLQ